MAEQGDNQNGRMLFTDLDVSDKGRPVPVLDGDELQGFIQAPLPTIADIASRLELDFEDDWDHDTSGHSSPDGEERDEHPPPDARRPTRRSALAAAPGDAEIALNEEPRPRSETAPTPFGLPTRPFPGAPTWEEYARRFRRDTPPPSPKPENPTAEDTAADAARADETFDREDVDDPDFDILSVLPPLPPEVMNATPDWPGGRLGLSPPPTVPYGGLERVEDWYAPPEEDPNRRLQHETKQEKAALTAEEADTEVPLGADEARAALTRKLPRPPEQERKPEPDSRQVDLFSDFDLDAMWEDKVRSAQRRSEPVSQSDTNFINLFNEVDLDGIWEEKRRRTEPESAPGKDPAPPATPDPEVSRKKPKAEEAEDTAILNMKDVLRPPGTPAESAPEAEELYSAKTRIMRKPTHKTKRRRKSDPMIQPPLEDVDFLSALDRLMDEDPDPSQEGKSGEAAIARDKADSGMNYDDFLDDGFVDEDVSSVQAPVVGNDDISELDGGRKGGKRGGKPRPDATKEPAEAPQEPQPEEDYIPGMPGAAAAAAASATPRREGNEDTAAGGESISPPRKKPAGLTPDDLLNDLDLDDEYAVNDNVSAPVIDDSAIDSLSKPKSGTEEMQAIMAGGGSGAGGTEPEEPAGSVAVNPMDVFASMDDMDFSDDGLDDEMRAMLEDEDESGGDADAETGEKAEAAGTAAMKAAPKGFSAKARLLVGNAAKRVLRMSWVEKLQQLIAWKENWWFYCDLFAAIIASASLAVIISYYIWYRR